METKILAPFLQYSFVFTNKKKRPNENPGRKIIAMYTFFWEYCSRQLLVNRVSHSPSMLFCLLTMDTLAAGLCSLAHLHDRGRHGLDQRRETAAAGAAALPGPRVCSRVYLLMRRMYLSFNR